MARNYPRLESGGELTRLMIEHYGQALGRQGGLPVAWVTSGAPVELLRAMDVLPVYPENYAAVCASQGAVPLCEAAERLGYSRDLCAYARISIGAAAIGDDAPFAGLGRPDLLVACNNICGTVVKWFQALAQRFAVPLFILDTPFLPDDTINEHALAYVAGQLEDLVRWLERRAARRLDRARLADVLALSNETVALWRDIRGLCRAHPSPLSVPDLFVTMAPIVSLRGTPEAVAFYRMLHSEAEQRVRQGVSAVAGERFRLLWDNIAIWPRIYHFFSQFPRRGACFVADTYTGAWDTEVEAGEPLEALARTYLGIFLNHSLAHRAERMAQLIGEYACDGFVMHANRSCKPFSLGQPVARRLVTDATGVPGLLFEADMADPRAYAEEAIAARVQAFLEALDGRAS
ncbi:MAG TPA: 2-hydroxyacyl-CoA dehydratase family protein [Anaerolineae bacterium]|nr:2-hydroxyacyl-CoA dehydratase family protein [Anaerolineae bacterium]HOR01499.1 2-hydroxyacyl-CoA dehydratase family protein [Anaerolineae bacterium]HPL29187.1 2-hydroxyacyl-CoA dehydratase family protein [Anaerolineae bacterium]